MRAVQVKISSRDGRHSRIWTRTRSRTFKRYSGSVGAWFYQALGGINIGTAGAGYRHIQIRPEVVRDLTSVSATVDTVRGRVSSSWTHSPGLITLDVTIPVNSDAQVFVPKEEQWTDVFVREGDRVVWEKGQFVSGAPGITGAKLDAHGITFDVGSGQYSFRLTGQ